MSRSSVELQAQDEADRATDPFADALVNAYPSLRRFAAVVAPWDVAPDDVVHDAIVDVLRSGRAADVEHVVASAVGVRAFVM